MSVKKIASFVKKHHVLIALGVIVGISVFFRFYNYGERYGFAYDQARDMIVAQYAVNNNTIPLIGPFSSAGPFVYGPQWYWILMSMILVFPPYALTPWIIQSVLYVGVVLIMYLIGKELKSKYLGLLLACLTAFSSGQIAQSVNLTSPSMVGILAAVATLFLIRSIKYSKGWDYFLLGFLIGNAICTHFQAIGLLVFLPLAFFFGKHRVKLIIVSGIGLFIPFIPLIVFDFISNHFESRNMLQYYLHDQYKTSFEALGRRWITYVGVFWPQVWARVIGGSNIVSYLLLAIAALYVCITRRKMEKLTLVLLIAFFAIFLQLRYFRGPLFDAYLTFLHPVMLSLTGILLYNLIKKYKYIGFACLCAVLVGSTWLTFKDISYSSSAGTRMLKNIDKKLVKMYPGKKIQLYDYDYKTSGFSIPLSFFVSRSTGDGEMVHLGTGYTGQKKHKTVIVDGITFVKLSQSDTKNKKWVSVNPENVYYSVAAWYTK